MHFYVDNLLVFCSVASVDYLMLYLFRSGCRLRKVKVWKSLVLFPARTARCWWNWHLQIVLCSRCLDLPSSLIKTGAHSVVF